MLDGVTGSAGFTGAVTLLALALLLPAHFGNDAVQLWKPEVRWKAGLSGLAMVAAFWSAYWGSVMILIGLEMLAWIVVEAVLPDPEEVQASREVVQTYLASEEDALYRKAARIAEEFEHGDRGY